MDSIQATRSSGVGDVGGQFDDAIHRLETAPRKARKKIPPDTISTLQTNKQQTTSATHRAGSLSGSGTHAAHGARSNAQVRLDRNAFNGLHRQDTREARAMATYVPPALPPSRQTSPEMSATTSSHREALTQAQTDGAQLRAALSLTLTDQRRQLATNQQLSRDLSGIDGQMREVTTGLTAASAQKTKAQQASSALLQSAQSVMSSAQGLVGVAQTLEQISQALSLIPIVGWSLGIALKAVATALQMIAKSLANTALGLQQRGQALGIEAQQIAVEEQRLQGQRSVLSVRRQQTGALLALGNQRLRRIQQVQTHIRAACDENICLQENLEGKAERGGARSDTASAPPAARSAKEVAA